MCYKKLLKFFGAFTRRHKKIFIIGNGFDLNFKLPTSPDNYKKYLESFTIESSSGSSSALDFFDQYIDDYWSNTEQSLADLDLVSLSADNVVSPDYSSDHESDRDAGIFQMQQLSDDVINARNEALALMVSEADSTHIDTTTINKTAFDNAVIISFNYTTTLERLYDLNKSTVLHIHGCLEDGDRLIFGFKDDESYSPDGALVTNTFLSKQLDIEIEKIESNSLLSRNKKDEQIESLRNNYDFNDYYIDEQNNALVSLYRQNQKNFQFDKLKSFLKKNIGVNSKVKEIVVLGHSLNDVDSEYFELIEKNIRPKYWKISQYNGSPCLEELKNYSFSKKIRFCKIDKFL